MNINEILDKLDFEISSELKVAISAAIKAGEEVRNIYENHDDYGVEIKGDESPVTKADLLSDEIILKELSKTNIPILSEENMGDYQNRKNSKKVWVVDPIDGTKDFINKTGEYSIMIGMLLDNKPELGVVYAPSIDKLYFAQKNLGAYLYSKNKITKLEVSNKNKISDLRLVISRNNFKEHELASVEEIKIEHFIRMGSCGIKFAEIGLGNADLCFYLSNNLGEWDVVASAAILESAGGKCLNKLGEELQFNKEKPFMLNGIIGSNGNCLDEIFKVIKKY